MKKDEYMNVKILPKYILRLRQIQAFMTLETPSNKKITLKMLVEQALDGLFNQYEHLFKD